MREGCGGGQRIALSTAVPGAPQAHRPYVHGPAGCEAPGPRGSVLFSILHAINLPSQTPPLPVCRGSPV